MKFFILFCILFCPVACALGQNIYLGTISKSKMCVVDTVWIPYSAAGTFQPDNFFAVQISDASGSFNSFTNQGRSISEHDSIPINIGLTGNKFKVRVIASDPYTISDSSNSFSVIPTPSPLPTPGGKSTSFFGETVFTGQPVFFKDMRIEDSTVTYLWSFYEDAIPQKSMSSSPIVVYDSEGIKSGRLTVSNGYGCSASIDFSLRVLSCKPVIPDSVHVVSGNESGVFRYVWVKSGASFTTKENLDFVSTIFVEPGGSLVLGPNSSGVYYLKTGASLDMPDYVNFATAVLGKGLIAKFHIPKVDTLYCDDLQFDYSQVGGGNEVRVEENPLRILNSPNGLQVYCSAVNISASVVNLLGKEMFSKSESDMLSLDLSSSPDGVYFAVITCGTHREIRKIAVIH